MISTEVGTGEAIEYKARIANIPGDTRKASKVEVTVPGAEGKFTPDSGSLTFTEPGEYTVYFNHTVNLDNDFQYALCSGPIRVSVFLKGDVNSDGRVGMLDIVTLRLGRENFREGGGHEFRFEYRHGGPRSSHPRDGLTEIDGAASSAHTASARTDNANFCVLSEKRIVISEKAW